MRLMLVLGIAVVLLATAGCGGGPDKVGGAPASAPVVLSLANGSDQPHELQPFADAVARVSHGSLRIRFVNQWADGRNDYETRVIGDVRAGRADLGWVGGRAWDAVGVRAFDALQAPLLIDSYALEARVAASRVTDRMLAALRPLGLVGLGVLPGPLRHLVSDRSPLLRPSDFRGRRIAFQGAPAAATALRVLGARPVRVRSGPPFSGFDAIETHVAAMAGRRLADGGRYVTADVTLWPRPLVVFAGPRALRRLSGHQLALLRQAAVVAAPAVLAETRKEERTAMDLVCDGGARLVDASAADIAALRQAVLPAYTQMERDPATRTAVAAIEHLRAQLAAGSDGVPACPAGRAAPVAAAIPDGTYVSSAPAEPGNRGAGRLRLVLDHGSFVLHEPRPDGRGEQIGGSGTFSEFRDHLDIRFSDGFVIGGRWSLRGGTLRIDITSGTRGDRVVWSSHPWIGRR